MICGNLNYNMVQFPKYKYDMENPPIKEKFKAGTKIVFPKTDIENLSLKKKLLSFF